jgi:cell division protein ZapA
MKTSHAVTVLGRELSVRSSASEAKVKAVEAFVNGKLQEIGSALKNGDAQLVLTLALLNTSEELLELRSRREQEAAVDSRINTMIAALETV